MDRGTSRLMVAGALSAVLAAACTGAGDPVAGDETEAAVLGIQVERRGDELVTFEPTEPPSPTATDVTTADATDDATGAVATTDPVTTEPLEAEPAPTDDTDDDVPSDDPAPAPTTATPTPTVSPSPSETPRALASREGHSYLTWFRDEEVDADGGSRYVWAEVSAAPVVTTAGSEPLRVTLVDLAGADDRTEPRRAQCDAFLVNDGEAPLRAVGELTVAVVVDGDLVSAGARSIDVTVGPGERRDLVAIGDVRVAVPDVAEVTCRVGFEDAASR